MPHWQSLWHAVAKLIQARGEAMQDDGDHDDVDAPLGGVILIVVVLAAFLALLCWNVWPHIQRAGMH